jgi:WD40 repeat protein
LPLKQQEILIKYENKSVGVYDLAIKKKIFLSEPNHSETIFDAKFHPLDPYLLATCSFDGKIKLWNIKSLRCIQTMGLETDVLQNQTVMLKK